MKQKFSMKWKSSKQPRKQRKYLANAPLHIKRKQMTANMSKELRKKHGKRSIVVRKGDTVLIMRGKNRKKKGKVLEVKAKYGKVYVEGIQVKKMDGSKANVPLKASNLQIIELNVDDARRLGGKKAKTEKKEEVKKEKSKDKKVEEKK